ncbi:peptide/nickel transport system ATP-binding protein [Williamsia limnetica]|uniref:Peptide/nickel transport system ATP-binding protein n=1 Tax=Williamsia limnetica TaxID=882452 RepID=A0A318RMA1_WILLI|nr:peptide/nickel transport system ATP-binding protein [Williamsia limnetica]
MSAAQLRRFGVSIATRGRRGEAVVGLRGVDLDVEDGQVTALVSESGCGKSLVALALCGLLPPGSSVAGDLAIGADTLVFDDERRWRALRGRTVGLIPQSPATSFTPVRTLGSQLDEVVRILGSDRDASELVALAGLPKDALALYPHELSGGMAQRAAVAAAIAGRPALVVADEPTSALDPELADLVWKLLRAIADDGCAVLVITHDLTSLLRSQICDSIAVMRTGEVVLHDAPAHVVSSPDDYISRLFSGVHA